MNNSIIRVLVLLALIVTVQASLTCVNASAKERCETLLDTKCTSCHYLTRVCQVLGKKSKRSWKRSIKNMIRYGTKLTSEEQKILLDCLSTAPPRDKKICK